MANPDSKLSDLQRKSFEAQMKQQSFIVERGLDAPGEGYDSQTEVFGMPTLIETFNEKVSNLQNGESLHYLDVGCGAGVALREAKQRWEDQIVCDGITAAEYGEEKNDDSGVNIVIDDAQSLHRIDSIKGKYDVITAVKVSMYLANPFALLRGIYHALKVDGVGYVTDFSFATTKTELTDHVINYLKKSGFVFEKIGKTYNVYVKKNREELVLKEEDLLNIEEISKRVDEETLF